MIKGVLQMKHFIKHGVLALFLAFFAVGCGGGGSESPTIPEPEQPVEVGNADPVLNIDPDVPLFVFGDKVSEEQKETFRDTAYRIMNFLADTYGITLNKNLTNYFYVDRENFLEAYQEFHNAPQSRVDEWIRLIEEENRRTGGDGWGTFDGDAVFILGEKIINNHHQLVHTLAHEYFHAVQTIGHSGPDDIRHIGPEWLTEGSARYIEPLTLEHFGYPLDGPTGQYSKMAEVNFVRNFEISLEDLETWTGFFRNPEYDSIYSYVLGRLAAQYLADNYGGVEAIFEYYRAFDPNEPQSFPFSVNWRTAFEDTFGISLDEFYEEFEEYRQGGFKG